jgi:hypothetical protein
MAKLIYSAIASADGYVEDAAGEFDWGAPDEELLGFVNDLERPVGTYLFGRRDGLAGRCAGTGVARKGWPVPASTPDTAAAHTTTAARSGGRTHP